MRDNLEERVEWLATIRPSIFARKLDGKRGTSILGMIEICELVEDLWREGQRLRAAQPAIQADADFECPRCKSHNWEYGCDDCGSEVAESISRYKVMAYNFRVCNAADQLRPGQPCGHPGCLHHVTHPCEGCGRIAGR